MSGCKTQFDWLKVAIGDGEQTMFQDFFRVPFLLKNINYGHSATCTGSENVIMIVFELLIAKIEM